LSIRSFRTVADGGGKLTFYGQDPIIPSRFRFGSMAAIGLAATSVAVAALWKHRTGEGQNVSVDADHDDLGRSEGVSYQPSPWPKAMRKDENFPSGLEIDHSIHKNVTISLSYRPEASIRAICIGLALYEALSACYGYTW
jgi:hypothetical protein